MHMGVLSIEQASPFINSRVALHPIRDCQFSKIVWTYSIPPRLQASFFSLELKECLLFNLKHRLSSNWGGMLPKAMAIVCWNCGNEGAGRCSTRKVPYWRWSRTDLLQYKINGKGIWSRDGPREWGWSVWYLVNIKSVFGPRPLLYTKKNMNKNKN